MKHLLSIDDLDRKGVEELLEQSDAFLDVLARDIPKVPALRGKTVVSLFYEESTRTRLSLRFRQRSGRLTSRLPAVMKKPMAKIARPTAAHPITRWPTHRPRASASSGF